MIKSIYRKIHPQTSVIYVLINTSEKWVDYQVGFTAKDGTIPIAFYPSESNEIKEFVEMGKDFDYFDYVVTHRQEKDQITIVCVPLKMITKEFKPYKMQGV